MLIAAASGRALAVSARRGGFVPLVADAFGDQDTLAAAGAHAHAPIGRAIDGDALCTALDRLAGGRHCAGIVCGTGFEDRPDLLERVHARWGLLGSSAEAIARVKDPLSFAAICGAANIPHPEVSLTTPRDLADWLVKRIGGAGGWHIRPAENETQPAPDRYFQRRVKGAPISVQVLSDGKRAVMLGLSAQWTAPTKRHPFRYGGAVRPADIADEISELLTAAVARLAAAVPLIGLWSADFMVDGQSFHLLEVNPRPGATFDLFEPAEPSLFALHLDACAGRLPTHAPAFGGAIAGAIVYAERDIASAPVFDWPEWTADRPMPGARVAAEQPLCSVVARARTSQEARALVRERSARIHALFRASVP